MFRFVFFVMYILFFLRTNMLFHSRQEMAQPPVDAAYELLDARWDGRHRCLAWSSGVGPPSLVLSCPREHWPLDERYVPKLWDTGLLPIARMLDLPHTFQFDAALLSALVDRWRPETHTFHFRWGEMIVTLQDIAMLTSLPLCGLPVVPPPKRVD